MFTKLIRFCLRQSKKLRMALFERQTCDDAYFRKVSRVPERQEARKVKHGGVRAPLTMHWPSYRTSMGCTEPCSGSATACGGRAMRSAAGRWPTPRAAKLCATGITADSTSASHRAMLADESSVHLNRWQKGLRLIDRRS